MTILGSSFAVSDRLLDYPMLTGQTLRYLLAAGALALLVPRSGGRPVRRGELPRLLALAATGLAGFNVCVLGALRHGSPAVVGTVVGATPVLLAILGPALARRRPAARLVLSGAIVVGGVALVQGSAHAGGSGHASGVGLLWALGALAGEVCFSLLAAPLLGEVGPVRVSAWACLLAVPELGLAAVVDGEWRQLRVPTAGEAVALTYLALVLTVVAFVCWYSGLRRLGAERAGMFAGLLPIAALLGAAVLDRALPTPTALLGTALVAAGLLAGLTAPTRPRAAAQPPAEGAAPPVVVGSAARTASA
jgi:drug/metabolite transporter (DMT)-like permease